MRRGSTRSRPTSRTTARSRSSPRASCSGGSPRAAPGCRARGRRGIRRCPRGRISSPRKRSGRSSCSFMSGRAGTRGRGRRVREVGMTERRARYAVSGAREIMIALAIAIAFPRTAHSAPLTQDTTAGKAVYQKWCAGCHGDNGTGDGEGARYMLPAPRDFTGAIYQIRSTASGNLPTDADLMRVIDEGLPGTAMPGWKEGLSDRERRDVLAYIKTFSTFFADTTLRPQPLEFGSAPGGGGDAVRIGRQFYDSIGCAKCHGDLGRGDGPSSPTLKDDAGHPIFAADLHQNWLFNGGGTVEDIYHRLRTGLDGTPMPSFSDLLDQKFLTETELWHVAQYVRSLSPDKPPVVRDVIRAPLIDRALPHAPD